MVKLSIPETSAQGPDANKYPIKDELTHRTVGYIEAGYSMSMNTRIRPAHRHICLFGKYRDDFDTHNECVAFARGVEAVINHLVKNLIEPGGNPMEHGVQIQCPKCEEWIPKDLVT